LPLSSLTLADLYLQQGLKAEASAVLSQVLKEEPENARAASRLAEVERPEEPARPVVEETPVPAEPAAVPAWPTAPITPLPQSALPLSMRSETAPAPVQAPIPVAAPSPLMAPKKTKAQVREASILGLKALLGAIEREAVEQRATEQGRY
jgi:hypothetical protein